jgi:hypothetical protein
MLNSNQRASSGAQAERYVLGLQGVVHDGTKVLGKLAETATLDTAYRPIEIPCCRSVPAAEASS